MTEYFEIFEVEIIPPNLVVIPQGSSLQFKYNNVQIESNKIRAHFNSPEIKNVIIDLGQVDYLDSIMISALIRLVQHTIQTGGQAVFCNACENMLNILESLKLRSLWPLVETREEAINVINSN